MVDALPNCTIIFKNILYVMCFNGIEIDKDGLRSKWNFVWSNMTMNDGLLYVIDMLLLQFTNMCFLE
jgi:hypothetical protein